MDWNNIKVGDTFRYKGSNGAVYHFIVTSIKEDNYIVQAQYRTKDGETVSLFGPANVTTLVKDDAQYGGVRLSQTYCWERKEEDVNDEC